MYQKIWSQTQVRQTHRQANMICLTTAIIKKKDTIERKITRNAGKRSRHNHRQATLISPTKETIKAKDAKKRGGTGNARNRNLLNYEQH